MADSTGIAWTDSTFNPWWGCEKVSEACDHCYAETFAKRTGAAVWGHGSERRVFGDAHWKKPERWNAEAEAEGRPRLVFCASMGDVFESRDDLDEERSRLWSLIERTPSLIWQLLTKRPEQIPRLVPASWLEDWPGHVWIGTTVEDQRHAALRIPRLLRVPAPVRFLSCEPLLGPLDLWEWLGETCSDCRGSGSPRGAESCDRCSGSGSVARVQWVIVGGESGPHRRPFDVDAARRIRDDCRAARVPFFFKQDGGLRSGAPGPADLDAVKQFPPQARR